jgi:hypothetical protein
MAVASQRMLMRTLHEQDEPIESKRTEQGILRHQRCRCTMSKRGSPANPGYQFGQEGRRRLQARRLILLTVHVEGSTVSFDAPCCRKVLERFGLIYSTRTLSPISLASASAIPLSSLVSASRQCGFFGALRRFNSAVYPADVTTQDPRVKPEDDDGVLPPTNLPCRLGPEQTASNSAVASVRSNHVSNHQPDLWRPSRSGLPDADRGGH